MPWLPPDLWLERCGPLAASLRADYKRRGGEDALASALAADPRRVVALVGAPGAGTSRMALHLASRASMAFYPDPLIEPDPVVDVAALTELVADAPDDVSPLVVLDGPSIDERIACLSALVGNEIHPRLHVLVPCDHATARRLRRLAGGYPTRSILVATVQGEATPTEIAGAIDPETVLPFALLGRCAAGRFDGQSAAVDAGAAAVAGDEVVCLLVDRAREAIVRAQLLDRADGEVRLARILEAEPRRHAAAFAAIARWTGDSPPEGMVDTLVAFSAESFPHPLEFWDRAIPLAPLVLDALARRAYELCDDPASAASRGGLYECRAVLTLLRGDHDAVDAQLRAGLELELPPAQEARLASHLAGITRDTELSARAVALARAGGEYVGVSSALRQHATLLEAVPDLPAAIACCDEWMEVEAAGGSAASLAAVQAFAVRLAVAADDHAIAKQLSERILAARTALGDVMGQLFAHYGYAGALFAVNDIDGAAADLERALALADHIGDDTGIGYCHWLLGSIADKRADPITAERHYGAAIDAYGAAGPVPSRLVARHRVASAAADGTRRQQQEGEGEAMPELEEGGPEAPVPPQEAPPFDLVQLLVRRDESNDS